MSHVLQRDTTIERPEPRSRVVELNDGRSEEVFSTLSSKIARSMLAELNRDPATQSDLADRVGTSIQNARYHLDNLVDAGLAEVVDQWYSEKGRQMDVYAATGNPLVLIVGTQPETGELRRDISEQRSAEAVLQPSD
jgi:DNA-binding transcriptional ArsR family regulator